MPKGWDVYRHRWHGVRYDVVVVTKKCTRALASRCYALARATVAAARRVDRLAPPSSSSPLRGGGGGIFLAQIQRLPRDPRVHVQDVQHRALEVRRRVVPRAYEAPVLLAVRDRRHDVRDVDELLVDVT